MQANIMFACMNRRWVKLNYYMHTDVANTFIWKLTECESDARQHTIISRSSVWKDLNWKIRHRSVSWSTTNSAREHGADAFEHRTALTLPDDAKVIANAFKQLFCMHNVCAVAGIVHRNSSSISWTGLISIHTAKWRKRDRENGKYGIWKANENGIYSICGFSSWINEQRNYHCVCERTCVLRERRW